MTKGRRSTGPVAMLLAMSLLAGCAFGQKGEQQGLFVNGHALAAPDDDAYGAGRQQLLSGNYGVAVRQLRAALRQRPDSPEVLNALGVAYDQLGRGDIAQGYFAQALALDPNSVQTLNNVARSLLHNGSTALAGTYLKRAAALDPRDPTVSSNLELLARIEAPRPKGGTASIAFRDPGSVPWIERASPHMQTLVTRPILERGAPALAADEPPLPLVNFVSLSNAEDRAVDESPAAQPVVENAPAIDPDARPHVRPAALTIANGNGRTHMAARTSAYLEAKGWRPARLLNADHFGYERTAITYKAGLASEAQQLAAALPVKAEIQESRDLDGDLLLRIGKDLLPFDHQIAAELNGGQQS